ncbi:hypothetical protein ACHAWF_017686, partial [Thalassiosira exigua]
YHNCVLEEILNLFVIISEITATTYRNVYFDGVVSKDTTLDYSGNFARMLGHDNCKPSASTPITRRRTPLGSTLLDPWISYSAGLDALAGHLHGLANHEVLSTPTPSLNLHGRHSMPRRSSWATVTPSSSRPTPDKPASVSSDQSTCPIIHSKIVDNIYQVMPGILTEHGKVSNPYPNVDFHSGILLWRYGLT